MSQTEKKQSRKRLRPWLEHHANANTFQGLNWLDREQKIFSISWKHQSNRNWDVASDAELFKAWALHTGKYREGDPENPPEWKTRLRTALTKLSDIEEMKELHNLSDPDNPYKAYRFLDEAAVSNSKCKSQPSPFSEASYSDSSNTSVQASPGSQIDFLEISDTEMEGDARNMDQPDGMNDMNNIPTVVLEKMKCQTRNCMNISEVKPSNLLVSNVCGPHMHPESEVPGLPSSFHCEERHPDNHYVDSTAPQQGVGPLSKDLEGIEGLFPLIPTITQNNMSLGSSLPSLESLPSMSSLNQNHVLKMQVYIVGKCVDEQFIDGEARLFCGDLAQQTQAMAHPDHAKAFGSMTLNQIAIPEIDNIPKLPSINPKQKKLIKDIQDNMGRGLLIGGNMDSIYTVRLCKAHVSIWTQMKTIVKLSRESNDVVNVFDLEFFRQQLREYSPKNLCQPSPSVTFIFGQQYKGDQQVLDMSHVLFCVKITHLEAGRLLQEDLDSALSSTTEDLTSKSNSEDVLADQLKATLTLKSDA